MMLSSFPHTFVAIVEAGSITQAANVLNTAKSGVSQTLIRLERQLGVKLAYRTTRKLTLTPAGDQFYRRCKEIVALSNMAKAEMEGFGVEPSGPITITAPHVLIEPIIVPALVTLKDRLPKVEPSIIAEDRRLDPVEHGIDLAIRVGDLEDSNLISSRIGTWHEILCASPDILKPSHSDDVFDSVPMIEALPYIAHFREPNPVFHTLVNSDTRTRLRVTFTPKLFGNTVKALAEMARQGLGVALLPEFVIVDDLKNGSLTRVLPHYFLDEKAISAIHAYGDMPPASVVEIIGAIRSKLNKLQQLQRGGWRETAKANEGI